MKAVMSNSSIDAVTDVSQSNSRSAIREAAQEYNGNLVRIAQRLVRPLKKVLRGTVKSNGKRTIGRRNMIASLISTACICTSIFR
jgi:hypothetical protein